MFSIFKSNNPGVVVLYAAYLFAFRVCFWFVDVDADFAGQYSEPLSAALFGWLKSLPVNFKALSFILSGVVCFIQALLINNLINEHKLSARKSYAGGLVFIIFSSFFKEMLVLSAPQLAFTFIILATGKLFMLIKKEKMYSDVYDVGFLVAIACLFYYPAFIYILFAYIGLGTVRAFSYREWMAVLMGFVSPMLIAFTFYYFTDTHPGGIMPQWVGTYLSLTPIEWGQIAAFLLCAAASFVLLPAFLYSSLIQVRKFTTLLFIAFFVGLVAFFVQPQISLAHIVTLCMSVAVVSTLILLQIKSSIVSEVIHIMLILLVLAGQYLPLFNLI